MHETNPEKYFPALFLLEKEGRVDLRGAYRYSVCKEWLRAGILDKTSLVKRTRNAFHDLMFRFRLNAISGETIILGFAPWDWRILIYSFLARKNIIIYHTSWHDWRIASTPRQPKPAFVCTLIRRFWINFLLKKNVQVVAVTPLVARSLKNEIGVDSIVIPHAVPNIFFELARENNSPVVDKLKLLYVGEVSEKKGIRTLLNLMKEIDLKNVELTVIGDGNLVSEVVNTSLPITYRGPIWDRKELASIMAEHDVLMALSRRTSVWEELFGIVIIEALAMGLAVMASDHVGPKMILSEADCLGVYGEDDQHLIVEQIKTFLNVPGSLVHFQSLQRGIADSYRIDSIATNWLEVIEMRGNADEVV
ncbi:glycosyltransferase [Halioxenophilus aromaticivorans]|uniref:glycosyltransferase family 4 protein n=1 Tax=Halioxenophilus aromaticivorans TaxID=1306992 RepID=UPI0031E7EAD6